MENSGKENRRREGKPPFRAAVLSTRKRERECEQPCSRTGVQGSGGKHVPGGGERERVSCGNGGKRQPCGLFAEGESDPQLSTETSRATGRESCED